MDDQTQTQSHKILMVCMGNICRSPTAEAVLRKLAEEQGLELEIDSAGTGAWHVGKAPDPRACAAAAQRGYALELLRARQVHEDDFGRFDLVLAMDQDNLTALQEMALPEQQHRIRLLLDFAPEQELREVPDPYYGGRRGFELVLDLIEQACGGLLQSMTRQA